MKKSFCVLVIMFAISIVTLMMIGVNKKDAMAYDTHMVEIQTRLKELGYYDGAINGVYDDKDELCFYEIDTVRQNKNKCYEAIK